MVWLVPAPAFCMCNPIPLVSGTAMPIPTLPSRVILILSADVSASVVLNAKNPSLFALEVKSASFPHKISAAVAPLCTNFIPQNSSVELPVLSAFSILISVEPPALVAFISNI